MTNEILKAMNEKDAGKYIVCYVGAIGKTRATIKNLNAMLMTRQDENMFCIITEETRLSGHFICEIVKYALDKVGHIIMVVKPLQHIPFDDGIINYFSGIWDYMFASGLFCTKYGKGRGYVGMDPINEEAARNHFYPDMDEDAARKQIVHDLVNGKLEIDELDTVLHYPSESLLAAKKMADMIADRTFKDKYPLLYERMVNDREVRADVESLESMINKWHGSYKKLGLSGAEDMVDEAECVISYYKSLNAKRKEEKKAAKKAAKEAKNA